MTTVEAWKAGRASAVARVDENALRGAAAALAKAQPKEPSDIAELVVRSYLNLLREARREA